VATIAQLDPGLAAPIILGVTAGAFLGTRVLVRLSNEAVRRVFLGVLGVLGIGLVLGAVQVVRGAHFVSHVLWAAWMCHATVLLSARALAPLSARAHLAPAAEGLLTR